MVKCLKHASSFVEDATRDVRVFAPGTVCVHARYLARHTQRASVPITFHQMQRSALSSVCLYEANEWRPFHLICKPFAVWKHSAVHVTNFSRFSPASQDCFAPASRTTHSAAYSIIYRACSTGLAFMNHVRSCCICVLAGVSAECCITQLQLLRCTWKNVARRKQGKSAKEFQHFTSLGCKRTPCSGHFCKGRHIMGNNIKTDLRGKVKACAQTASAEISWAHPLDFGACKIQGISS
jgi:hypothetical protein